MQSIVFDIDGVIAKHQRDTSKPHFYKKVAPFEFAIPYINRAYEDGFKVVLATARYMTRFKGNIGKVYKHGFDEAYRWMKKHGVKFHELHLGKPAASMYVDDLACHVNSEQGEDMWKRNFLPRYEELKHGLPA